ncbi:MAG: LytTR family DNA-binding domain-containing protein [Defluviitaleaceae bacterium]|nr:LytTR family DNA-binding domain-containing protein [Defluviitaleaceae bacterium]
MLLKKYNTERPETPIVPRYFSTGMDLLGSMNDGQMYDLFLLDIQMPGINGIELAKSIREKHDDAVIIYITKYTDYAFEAYGVRAAHYLQKPVKESTLFPVLDKVLTTAVSKKKSHYILSSGEGLVSIPFSSIICAELSNRRLRLHLENGQTITSKSLQTSFSKSIAPLLKDERFLHVHQAFVVNIAHVVEQRSNSFVAKHGIVIPISRNRYGDAKKKFLALK